jgi:hypothetical protein
MVVDLAACWTWKYLELLNQFTSVDAAHLHVTWQRKSRYMEMVHLVSSCVRVTEPLHHGTASCRLS